MERALEIEVRERAGRCCEYSHLQESTSTLRHVIDHIIARQHGGATVGENLALSCGRCNLCKGPNIAGVDALDGAITRLYNPRIDRGDDHFQVDDSLLIGVTAIGRATVMVLAMNEPARLAVRQTLQALGRYP